MNIFNLGRKYLALRAEFDAATRRHEDRINALEKALVETRQHCDREIAEIRENTPRKAASHHTFLSLRRMAEEGARKLHG